MVDVLSMIFALCLFAPSIAYIYRLRKVVMNLLTTVSMLSSSVRERTLMLLNEINKVKSMCSELDPLIEAKIEQKLNEHEELLLKYIDMQIAMKILKKRYGSS